MARAKVNYKEHQQAFNALLMDEPGLRLVDYCERAGLKYASVRRYLKKPTKAEILAMQKQQSSENKPSKATHDWVEVVSKFLALATKNPSLTMAAYAKEIGVKPASFRRNVGEMRKRGDFRSLFDRYDRQMEEYSRITSTKKSKRSAKTTANNSRGSAHTIAHQEEMCTNRGTQTAHSAQFDAIDDPISVPNRVHGGYCALANIDEEIFDAVSKVDPLSVTHELLLARAQLLTMTKTINGRVNELNRLKREGIESVNDGGEDNEPIDKVIYRYLFGFNQRFRELEVSITNMASLENKRRFDARKQKVAELMLPGLLPAAEAKLVTELLQQRAKNNWDAVTTATHIEKLGAKVPAMLIHEAKHELATAEPEVEDDGMTLEELDQISLEYRQNQQSILDEWKPNRIAELQKLAEEQEARENGESLEGKGYDSLDDGSKKTKAFDDFDSLDNLEVMG